MASPLGRVLAAALILAAAAHTGSAATQDATLDTGTGTLAGTLVVPRSRGKMPVALIIAGSGPTDRNGNSALLPGPNNSLKMLADALAASGIASLRYDKRGIGASSGAATSESDLRFDTYVDDAAAWIGWLRSDRRFSTVTVIGHSEGSLIGMIAARKAGADRVVSIAGAGSPAADVLVRQLEPKLPPAMMETSRHIIDELKAGRTVDDVTVLLYTLFRPSVQPYLISWFRYDPAAEAARLSVPLLVVQGTTDIQVTVDDAKRIASGAHGATLLVIDCMNHVLKDVGPETEAQQRSYGDPSLPLDQHLASAVASFIRGARRH